MNIEAMRVALDALTTEREEAERTARAIQDQLSRLTDRVNAAKSVLWDERAYREKKLAAQREIDSLRPNVAECTAELQQATNQARSIDDRIRDLRAKLTRAEYESVSIADLKAAGKAIAGRIVDVDNKLQGLRDSRSSIERKREQAGCDLEAVASAESEVNAARGALESAQGDAYLSEVTTDLAPYTARLAKAERRLASANEGATLARAAMPRIEARITGIDAEIAELEGARAERVAEWWQNRARIADAVFTARVSDLAASLRDRLAIDTRTGGNLGMQLLEKARTGLYVPVMGKHTEAFNWSTVTGHTHWPDVTEAVDRIDAELQTAAASDQ